jgi:hypothetical protein
MTADLASTPKLGRAFEAGLHEYLVMTEVMGIRDLEELCERLGKSERTVERYRSWLREHPVPFGQIL